MLILILTLIAFALYLLILSGIIIYFVVSQTNKIKHLHSVLLFNLDSKHKEIKIFMSEANDLIGEVNTKVNNLLSTVASEKGEVRAALETQTAEISRLNEEIRRLQSEGVDVSTLREISSNLDTVNTNVTNIFENSTVPEPGTPVEELPTEPSEPAPSDTTETSDSEETDVDVVSDSSEADTQEMPAADDSDDENF